jgi:hypothetical protein
MGHIFLPRYTNHAVDGVVTQTMQQISAGDRSDIQIAPQLQHHVVW